ncbi:undecaprenyl-phosphate glucose phosphotransferase [Chlorobium sp. N1]|nr:undecaprenyl-phosphate glucose phosphotransferase [Chlorobium sp. N1]
MGHWAREQVLRLFDAAVWIVGAYVAGSVWFGVSLEAKGWIHLMLAYVFPLVAFMLYTPMGCYRSWRSLDYFSVAKPVVLSIILVGITALTFTFLMHEISALSRVWFLLTLSFVLGTSVSVRIAAVAIMRWLRRNGSDLRRILLVGDAQSLDGMRRSVADNPGFGYSIVSTLDYVETASVSILDIMAGKNIDEVWMTSSPVTMDCMSPLIAELSRTPVSVRWIPDIKWHALLSAREENLMGHPSFLLNATAIDGSQGRLLKAVFDRFFALLVLVVLSPLFLCIAVLVKLTSPGPVIFRQARQGISGRSFHCLKFRTMVTHSEENGLTQATVNDRRVTPLGAFLRRTSLDELPQFINVLLGDMSVVGPRPHAIQHNEFYTKQVYGYMQRHRTKPGITGWAQINGYRGETDTLQKMIKRVEYDIYYMKNWSFLLDLKIIFATAFSGWMGRNAY